MRKTIPSYPRLHPAAMGAFGVCLAMLTIACGSGGTSGSGGTPGSMDSLNGTWTLLSSTCNGSPVNMGGATTTFAINGSSGSVSTTISGTGAGSCTITTPLTVTYPETGSVTWTEGTTSCNPANCLSATYCSAASSGLQYAGTYVLAGNQATFTVPTVTQGDPSCSGGNEVMVLQKQ
jgi:hypothetical protein